MGKTVPAKADTITITAKPSGGKAKSTFLCEHCGRTFAMAIHLGRHVTAAHAAKQASAAVPEIRSVRPEPAANGSDLGAMSGAALIGMRRQIDSVLAGRVVRDGKLT